MFQAKLKVLAAGDGSRFGGAGVYERSRRSNVALAQSSGRSDPTVAEQKSTAARESAAAALIQWIGSGDDKSLSDEEFIRRAYLDLLGRLPTVAEVQTFKKNALADRRTKLIDSLIENQTYDAWAKRFLGIQGQAHDTRISEYERAFRAQTNAPAIAQFLNEIGQKNAVDRELVRRIWLDFFGMPPTEKEI